MPDPDPAATRAELQRRLERSRRRRGDIRRVWLERRIRELQEQSEKRVGEFLAGKRVE
jgi:hypothetical protein